MSRLESNWKNFFNSVSNFYSLSQSFHLHLDNRELLFKRKFKRAYDDVPKATADCHDSRLFFQAEYNVKDEDIIRLYDTDYE